MIVPNIEEKLGVTTDKLNSYRVCLEKTLQVYYTDEAVNGRSFPSETADWKPFDFPFVLYEEDKYYWFKTEFTVEKTETGKSVYFCVNTFLKANSTIRPQGLLYLNGKAVQGIDVNHTDVRLCEGTYTAYLLFYTHTFGKTLPLYFTLKTTDDLITSVYYDLRVPLDGIRLLKKNTEEYEKAADILERAVNRIDFRRIYSEEFYASLKDAKEYLYREFYGGICGNRNTVFCIGHTHIDVAWLWDTEQTRRKTERSFSTVLKLMEEYPEYRFMSSQPQLFDFLKNDNPELYARVKAKIQEGTWEADGAMWLEADCNLTSGESLVRQIYYGKKFFKEEFGQDCTCVWLPDVFGYSAALPQIMKKSGIDRFVTAKIGWNDTNRFPYDAFIWQGTDGSKVFAYLLSACYPDPRKGIYDTTFTSYCPALTPQTVLGARNRFTQKEFSDAVMTSYGYGDGGGGPTAEMLEYGRRMVYGLPGIPKTRLTSLKNALDEIEKNFFENAGELKRIPKWNGELYFEYHRGTLTSVPMVKAYNRKGEFAMMNTELFATLNALVFNAPYPYENMERKWKILLLNQFHDILPGSAIKKVYEDSKSQYERLFFDCDKENGEIISRITGAIDCENGTAVFNPNAFTVCGTVVADGKTRIVENVPACGYVTVTNFKNRRKKVTADVKTLTLENVFFKAVFEKSGAIVSLTDKREGREIVPAGEKLNEMRSYENMPYEYENWELTPYHKQKEYTLGDEAEFTIIEDGDRVGFKIVKTYYDSVITQEVCLYADTIDRIDFLTDICWKEKNQVLKARFPLNLLINEAVYDMQFGPVRRSTSSNTSWDAARFECAAHKWVDASEYGYGVALLNDAKYGFSAEDNVLTITLVTSGGYPYEGEADDVPRFTYSLLPHKNGYAEGKVIEKAYVLNRPLIAAKTGKGSGVLPKEFSLLSVQGKGAYIETVKKSEDGVGVIMRIYEGYGERKQITVCPNFPFQKAYLCDLSENRLSEAATEQNIVRFEIKPFEIVTLEVV